MPKIDPLIDFKKVTRYKTKFEKSDPMQNKISKKIGFWNYWENRESKITLAAIQIGILDFWAFEQ